MNVFSLIKQLLHVETFKHIPRPALCRFENYVEAVLISAHQRQVKGQFTYISCHALLNLCSRTVEAGKHVISPLGSLSIISQCLWSHCFAPQDDWWWPHHPKKSRTPAWEDQQAEVENCWECGGGGESEIFTKGNSIIWLWLILLITLCCWIFLIGPWNKNKCPAGETCSSGERSGSIKA